MKAVVNILNSFDEYFEDKSDNEKWGLIGIIALAIGYLSYAFFYPVAEEKYHTEEKRMKKLEKSIRENKNYLQDITKNGDIEFYVKKYSNDIKNINNKIDRVNDEISFISVNLEKLSPLLFNKESWSKFLNSITKQAKKEAVNIDYIENNYVDNNGSFGHVLQISVGCFGQYKQIVKFVNQLEKSVLVTDIYGSHLYLDKNDTVVAADINISVWGINK